MFTEFNFYNRQQSMTFSGQIFRWSLVLALTICFGWILGVIRAVQTLIKLA